MALFSLIANLTLDKTGFDAGLSSAQKTAGRFAASLKSQLAAAFSVAAVSAYTRALVQYASSIKDAALRTGASTDALQTFAHAAKQTGQDLGTVVKALKELSVAREKAILDPRSKEAQVFRALELDLERLKGADPAQFFREVGGAFGALDFGPATQAMAAELGRGVETLLPLFREGLDELEAQAREAGIVIGEELIEPLDAVGDQFDELTGQLRGPFAEALVFVLKQANELLNTLKRGFEVLTNFAQGFKSGFGEQAAESTLPKWVRAIPAVGAFTKIGQLAEKFGRGIDAGKQQVGEALDEAQQEERPEDGFMFGFAKDQKERKRREFHFENIIKEREPKMLKVQADSLGRIGGTVGGGENTTNRQLRDLIRETKELRRTLEIRGVRIFGEI